MNASSTGRPIAMHGIWPIRCASAAPPAYARAMSKQRACRSKRYAGALCARMPERLDSVDVLCANVRFFTEPSSGKRRVRLPKRLHNKLLAPAYRDRRRGGGQGRVAPAAVRAAHRSGAAPSPPSATAITTRDMLAVRRPRRRNGKRDRGMHRGLRRRVRARTTSTALRKCCTE